LRHPDFVSEIKDFTTGTRFQEIIDDPTANKAKVKTLLLCSGKIAYDLLEKKRNDKRDDVAVVRLEQLYPLPENQLEAIFKKYAKAQVRWVQEEPANNGAWMHILFHLCEKYPMKLVSRPASASPATGYKKKHDAQQVEIMEKAFAK
jgi:2-oxoglutarate dehydrogenase E1 component